MTKNELAQLVDFIGKKFDAQKRESERRFDRLEQRFDALEARFDALEARFDALEARFDVLEARFDRFELIFRADRLDVQQRLKALEN